LRQVERRSIFRARSAPSSRLNRGGIATSRSRAAPYPRRPSTQATARSSVSCAVRRPSLRLRDNADVRTRSFPALWIGLLRVLVGHRAGDNNVITVFPVDRRRNLVSGRQL